MIITTALFVIGAYLLGSVCAAIIVCKLFGLADPRSEGSNNPGATNVMRIGGKVPALITLIGDFLKGLLPALLASQLGLPDLTVGLVMLAAFLGHLYPVFFKFEGGKGVATALGVLFGMSGWIGLFACAVWLMMALLFRMSSLASLTAAALSPVATWWLLASPELIIVTAIMAVLQFWRHRSNIEKLLAGTESKIGEKTSEDAS